MAKNRIKLYLAVKQWSESDGWDSGDAGANVIYATLSKDKMDNYLEKLSKNGESTPNLVTIDLDTDYIEKVDKGTKTEVASWFDEVPSYYLDD